MWELRVYYSEFPWFVVGFASGTYLNKAYTPHARAAVAVDSSLSAGRYVALGCQ